MPIPVSSKCFVGRSTSCGPQETAQGQDRFLSVTSLPVWCLTASAMMILGLPLMLTRYRGAKVRCLAVCSVQPWKVSVRVLFVIPNVMLFS